MYNNETKPPKSRAFVAEVENQGSEVGSDEVEGVESEEEEMDHVVMFIRAPSMDDDKCVFCAGGGGKAHKTIDCATFEKLPVKARRALIRALAMCWVCGSVSHLAKECKEEDCSRCRGRHNTRLHVDARKDKSARSERESKVFTTAARTGSGVALTTCPVLLRNPFTKQEIWVNALLDSGNSLPLLSRNAAEQLGLKGYKKDLNIHLGTGLEVKEESLVSRVEVCGADGRTVVECTIRVINDPTGLVAFDWAEIKEDVELLKGLDIARPVGSGKVELILGCNLPKALAIAEERVSEDGRTGVRKTPFGWVPYGVHGVEGDEGVATTNMTLHSYRAMVRECGPWKPSRELDFSSSYAGAPPEP